MSFFTSLIYYRPRKPPTITADDIAKFIVALQGENLVTDSGFQWLQLKFGSAIDQDRNPTSWQEEVAPRTHVYRSIEWDLDIKKPKNLNEMVGALRGDNRRVYRASISFGSPIDAVLAPITRTNSPENEIDFYPDTIALQIGPTEIYELSSERPALVGWMGLVISGNGYLFPWTFQDVYQRIQSAPEIQRLAELGRSFWPVPPETPEPNIVEVRKELGTLWPYDRFDAGWDWYWGPAES